MFLANGHFINGFNFISQLGGDAAINLAFKARFRSINAVLIRQGLSQTERIQQLNEIAILQMTTLVRSNSIKSLKEK